MVVTCEVVWREISNYLEDDVTPELRVSMDEHIHGCTRCQAVLAGTRNIVELYGDERMVDVPFGFSSRLQSRIQEAMPQRRGSAWGWMVALAFAAMLLISFEVGSSSAANRRVLRSQLAQPGKNVPAAMLVVVSDGGKTFHVASCPFIHDKAHERTITAAEAMREGYVPCIRCMREYLNQNVAQLLKESEESGVADGD
jgi:hypothetical protein